MATIDPDRLAALDGIRLDAGKHTRRAAGMCAMEAAAWLVKEKHSDHPQCVDPVIAAFVRVWQDRLDDDQRELLVKPLIPLLVGTRSTPAVQLARAIACADWTIRHVLPTWLRLTPSLVEHANRLAALPELTTVDALNAAHTGPVAAARDAARDAVAEAAEAAARFGARSAWVAVARAAARSAWAAAWAAARDAVDVAEAAEAAADAAEAAAAATAAKVAAEAVHQLHADAVTLIHRLITTGEQQ